MMLMASALTNHWVVGRSSHHAYRINGPDGCFKVLTQNHSGIKGNQFLPRENVASTGQQSTRSVPKDPKKILWPFGTASYLVLDKDGMKSNMKSIKSQEDFDEQLLTAGDKFTVVHFFSPSCGACKALHSRYINLPGCIQDCNFLWSTDGDL